jgi:ribosome-binding factor A
VTSRRLLKAAEAIREVVAASILTELRDPRVQDVTVVGVKVSPDMREAQVAVSIMGDESQQQLSLRGLQNAAGFLQSRIASRIEARYTPRLQFVIDKGIQHSLLVGEILEKIKRESDEPGHDGMLDQDMSEENESTAAVEVNSSLPAQDGVPEGPLSTGHTDDQAEQSDSSGPTVR